jgi:hypothetical protein
MQVKQPVVSESMYAYRFKSENENALTGSMKISNCFACEGEAHTIGEKLVKPCAVNLTACMIDKEGARNSQPAPLYDSTIQRRIQDCAANTA